MRKILLLSLLALMAAPLPAAAQSGGVQFCFENDTNITLFRIRTYATPYGGFELSTSDWERVAPRQQHCVRSLSGQSARIEVQHWQGYWQPADGSGCGLTIRNPTGVTTIRARKTTVGHFVCTIG